ncbi:Adenylyltransferase and sulfurtransferase uba4 [Penicillium cataractarum]|uniref:Adenylyltransferase and sulfurtransferase uba4 n=1 Tax=Penicillium cataractarum TaxID=2100454 RepID=A0A9W9RZK0_9EURO|nr:Adenylyltransferase and sulfurtransferase uba4 [Penicillium cataractarum]KAJ5369307.1 Adenylyltransferase and sulfurtransferase uba4 [Penicillium cataractarum]
MSHLEEKCASLRAQIAATEAQLAGLKRELASAQEAAAANSNRAEGSDSNQQDQPKTESRWPLLQEEYKRYGRQMIVSQVGLEGQLKLRAAKVLLVGAGGLGCPAAQYLAGAGVGTLGLIDGDTVEVSNLHRQVLHRSRNVGKFKVDSAIESLRELNPHPTYIAHRTHLMPSEAPVIFAQYDLILDCTDNPATRYLISDTAVLLGKPLVSASALRTEGQLMVLNNPPRRPGDKDGGPCYRCVFPKPPPADSVVSCADGGILGPVVGTMGVLQALEAIKVITTGAGKEQPPGTGSRESPLLHMFSAYSNPLFRTIRIRSRRTNCAVCSAEATITLDTITSGSTDYVFFCGSAHPPSLLAPDERISAREYHDKYSLVDFRAQDSSGQPSSPRGHTIIDVRDKVQFGICSLEESINIPISNILAATSTDETPSWVPAELAASESNDPIYVVCRLGNDSQLAVQRMKDLGLDRDGQRFIGDIRGGLRAWREQVDPQWPEY